MLLTVFNAALLMVDHIHFQYNGMMYGMLILAIVFVLEVTLNNKIEIEPPQGRFVWSAVVFSILLNLKHIYIYVGPPFFVYMLRVYCFIPDKGMSGMT